MVGSQGMYFSIKRPSGVFEVSIKVLKIKFLFSSLTLNAPNLLNTKQNMKKRLPLQKLTLTKLLVTATRLRQYMRD